jgi:hypothetical protein
MLCNGVQREGAKLSLALASELFCSVPLHNIGDGVFEHALTDPLVVSRPQRLWATDDPHWKIPPPQWPTVLRRVEQGESLRQMGRQYGVSYETIRRVLRAAPRC